MPNTSKHSLAILNYYKSFGVETHIQNKPRIRFKNYSYNESKKEILNDQLKELEKKIGPIKDLGEIEKIEFHYGLIPNDGLSRKTVYDNLILVGDSAGQANPLVLEGIRYAIRFGEVAGKVAADAIKNGDTTESSLNPYEKEWKKAIESKINSAVKVQNRWVGLTDDEWDNELDIINELTADEFLDFIRADFGVSKMVKLATHHPKMIVRQLFNIVKGA